MATRAELLEATLDSWQGAIAVLSSGGEVALWNQAAEAVMGYPSTEVIGHSLPRGLEPLAAERGMQWERKDRGRGMLVKARHKLGHEMQLITHAQTLRDGLGARIGTALLFHPAEELETFRHGVSDDNSTIAESQAELDEHLRREFDDCATHGLPFGVLWIKIDQAVRLRKSHGAGACEAMVEKLKHALVTGIRPAEILGRWGDDEFLIISREREPEMLAAHARVLVEHVRATDFKWWGDRITLTVSIGVAQATRPGLENLMQLLERAQRAMEASVHTGGNRVTQAPGVHECSQS
jgi:diguanylate cyclase (GGDEF)-like protein/PAS domain S-box-containing protein